MVLTNVRAGYTVLSAYSSWVVCDHAEFTCELRMVAHRRTVDHFRMGFSGLFGIKSKTSLVRFAMHWGLVEG